MNKPEFDQKTIVSGAVGLLHEMMDQYDWVHNIIIETIMGFDGMGPDFRVRFIDLYRFHPLKMEAEIQLWQHPYDGMKCVLMYTAVSPDAEEFDLDNESLDIEQIEQIRPYLDKAMSVLKVDRV